MSNRPIHFEILSDDPESLVEFYKSVLGWEIATWDGPQEYWLATTGHAAQGINGALMRRHFDQAVINTVDCDDLDALQLRVEEGGGSLAFGPRDVPGAGRHAYFMDPAGILFGAMERRS